MNCGLCAEYCPFDAIKMDHDFEIASYDRFETNIYDKAKLSKPASYYASIRPTNNRVEEIARAEKEAAKAAAVAARKAAGPPAAGPTTAA
jgi:NADH-quinone oxidoreductase subunit I